jgi:Tat protein secretion system quality control protein TatD with DNase activity
MRIQVFSEYLQLAQAGKVNFLACPMHTNEEAVFPLIHQQEEEDIVLHCYACGYKNIAGYTLYNNLITLIKAQLSEPEKMEQ